MQLGIIGLPTSGKTTLFNALTGSDRPTSAATTGKMEVHTATVNVPDARLDELAKVLESKKIVPAQITYMDVAGLGGAERGSALSGQLRNQLQGVDGFLHVVRVFEDATVPHPEETIDPQRDLETLDMEFVLSDLSIVENRMARIGEELGKGRGDKGALNKEKALMERIQPQLEESRLIRDMGLADDELDLLRSYAFLTLKPVIVVANAGAEDDLDAAVAGITYDHTRSAVMALRGELEMEIAQLDGEDRDIFMAEYGLGESGSARVIRESYALLGMQTFFTGSEKDAHAWPVRVGASAVDAAETIHSDLARGFIRAEVAHYTELLEAGGWTPLKSQGKIRVEGRDYVVQDGDYIIVRFNV